jgi:hypothetical protein
MARKKFNKRNEVSRSAGKRGGGGSRGNKGDKGTRGKRRGSGSRILATVFSLTYEHNTIQAKTVLFLLHFLHLISFVYLALLASFCAVMPYPS